MIRSFSCSSTERLWLGHDVARFRPFRDLAERKLKILDSATILGDLTLLPGNHLEKLAGDRKGQHSIRVTRQWRICFKWDAGGANDVEIVDYH